MREWEASGAGGRMTHELFESLYATLRGLAADRLRSERAAHSLGPTALVHEVYLRLAASPDGRWASDEDFIAAAAVAARRVLVDHARRRLAAKRGGGRAIPLGPDIDVAAQPHWRGLIEIDEVLRQLTALDERRGRVAELRVFGGLTNEQIASALGVSRATVAADWTVARGWLSRRLREVGV